MINLMLVRHGECLGAGTYIGRGSDVPLNDQGIKQLYKVADILTSINENRAIDFLYSSPMIRAKDSAEILSEKLKLPIDILYGIEEIDFGDWEGLSYNDLEQESPDKLKKWLNNPMEISPPVGETLKDLQKRTYNATDFLNEKIIDTKEWNIVLVSHRGPLVLMILRYLKLDFEYYWNFRIDRGSVSKVKLYPRFTELEFLNRKF